MSSTPPRWYEWPNSGRDGVIGYPARFRPSFWLIDPNRDRFGYLSIIELYSCIFTVLFLQPLVLDLPQLVINHITDTKCAYLFLDFGKNQQPEDKPGLRLKGQMRMLGEQCTPVKRGVLANSRYGKQDGATIIAPNVSPLHCHQLLPVV